VWSGADPRPKLNFVISECQISHLVGIQLVNSCERPLRVALALNCQKWAGQR